MRFDAVVISDLHLGARNCRADDLLRFLDWIETDRLVLAGDIFDCPRLSGLAPPHLRVLETLRVMSAERRVDWLRGNHDPEPEYWDSVLGIPIADETELEVGDKRYLVFHGHRWDVSLDWPRWLVNGADQVYRLSQALDPSHRLSRFLKHRCKRFCRTVDRLQRRSVVEARRRLYDGVTVGHTHVSQDIYNGNVHFLNSGCWTEKPASFVGVRGGQARRYHWDVIVRRGMSRATAPAIAARRFESGAAVPA